MGQKREWTHVTLFVSGVAKSLAEWGRRLETSGLTLRGEKLSGGGLPCTADVEWVENPGDESFGQAFSYGTASPREQREIDASPGAVVLSLPVDLHRQRQAIASLARCLNAAGAMAIRVEQSKLGYPIGRWIALVDQTDVWALYNAAVVVLASKNQVATCGMHAFSLPDAQVALDDHLDATEANHLLGVLNVYQIEEAPVLVSGHTFSPSADAAKRVLQRWPDARYPAGHACHNPFGVWRLGSAGSTGIADRLALVFMPSLAAVLMAAERKNGQPLTQKEVESIRDACACMAMEHRDAQAMEQSRGYADLDPRLAWEQWQIVREHPEMPKV